MDVIDLKRKAESEEDNEILIYNPLPTDFTWKYDGIPYTIPSKENKSFKTHLANHLGKHLVDEYLNTKDKYYPREKAEKLVFP
jgi:hypothetical protein